MTVKFMSDTVVNVDLLLNVLNSVKQKHLYDLLKKKCLTKFTL